MNTYFRLLFLIIASFSFVMQSFATTQNTDFLDTLNPFWKVPKIDSGELVFTLNIPIHNSGSVGIIPSGKIEILDPEGNKLKNIGIDGERNELGTLLQAKIVDYIPLNPEGRKVSAGQSVSFSPEWKGFADRFIKDGIPSIEFSSPLGDKSTIPSFAPWEKLRVIEQNHVFTAQVHIEYRDLIGGKIQKQELSLPLEVPSIQVEKQLNYGLIAIIVLGIILIFVLIIPRRKEIVQEKNKKAIHSLEKETKKVISKIKKKSSSGGSKKIKKQVKKIKNTPKK